MRRRASQSTKIIVLLTLVAILSGLAASLAEAELSVSGNLFVVFNGGIYPEALPRHRRVPITVKLSGRVRTLSAEQPPALRKIVIKLNRNGRLYTRGLPVCYRHQIEALTSAQALATCRDALVGTGAYVGKTAYPEQQSFVSHGRLLAFNSIQGGKRAILTHVFSGKPAPIARTFLFQIAHTTGPYGTVLRANLPPSLNRFGYLKRISLNLHRTYTYHGTLHPYLSAACPAPSGFQEASFNFAFASMSFADGRTLMATMNRTCLVAG
ncbi:MAG TPA: hypothetical protein VND98_11980 [Solirubrobacterales bacterium]|nr:hypothetical protein [Solirubrobacterales bacterium]